jgi:hypothetical protein
MVIDYSGFTYLRKDAFIEGVEGGQPQRQELCWAVDRLLSVQQCRVCLEQSGLLRPIPEFVEAQDGKRLTELAPYRRLRNFY